MGSESFLQSAFCQSKMTPTPFIGEQRQWEIRVSNRNILRSIGLLSAVLLLGCAVTAVAQDRRQQFLEKTLSAKDYQSIRQEIAGTLTVEAYQRIVPRIAALKAGDRITSKLEWNYIPVNNPQGKMVDAFALLDGWVGPLSGDVVGTRYGFGSLVGRTGDVLLGEHVFGYLLFGVLKPQYVIVTEATVISEDEFKQRDKKADDYGLVDAVVEVDFQQKRERRARIYYKGLKIKETRQLKFTRPDELKGARLGGEPTALADKTLSFVTIERFREAEKKLESLTPGTDYWDVLFALNMQITTLNSGITYRVWLADGYLGQAWERLTPGGNFFILRFGYIQDNNEVPKLALIFKNGRVHKLVPYATQE